MTMLHTQAVILLGLPGNHVIAAQSHKETIRALQDERGFVHQPRRSAAELPWSGADSALDHANPQDCIDEAILESFPASDPPAFTCCHA